MTKSDHYSENQLAELADSFADCDTRLASLIETNLSHALKQSDNDVQEYLKWGVGRRLNVIQLAARRIFMLFPTNQNAPLARETIYEVQIYLHAMISNVSGVFDCWAWAYILRHGYRDQFESVTQIGMFLSTTRRLLPTDMRDRLRDLKRWHRYIKEFRDALAHRIPLYIPPAVHSSADRRRYDEIEADIDAAFRRHHFDLADRLVDEQLTLGRPCFTFHHGLTSERKHSMQVHAQVMADIATIVDFGQCFYDHWHEPAPTSALAR